jgi:Fe-Mn family superoxide dismutase
MLCKHTLPSLPYGYESLEPHIDARTMQIHHDKHHAAYVANLNSALEKSPQLQDRSALWLLLNLDQVPESIRTAVRNNAGGHVNHSLLWRVMTPDGQGTPKDELAKAIERNFGSFDKFRAKFAEAGAKLFGSGWVWLARERDKGGKLVVVTTNGHDNPLMQGLFPLLVNDVWEHAYYLKHQNRRPEYLDGWWSVVNWHEVARRFACAGHGPEHDWEYDDQLALAA